MKKNDESSRPLPPPAVSTNESLHLKAHDQEALIAELRTSLSEAIERTRSAEEITRQACEDGPLAYFAVDRQWLVLKANRAAGMLWNTETHNLPDRDMWELLGRGRPGYSDSHLTALHKDGRVSFEHFSFPLKKWIKIHISAAVQGFSLWIEDMSSLKMQVEAHTRLWKQQKALADNSPDIILRFGVDGTCIFANRAIERILGLDPASVMRKKLPAMDIPADAAGRLSTMLQKVFATGEALSEEFEIAMNGVGKFFSWRAVPERGIRTVDSVLFVGRNVTAEKEAEEVRQALEAQVRESQKLEAVGVLSGGIAHDFNNILAVILGNAELALDDTEETSPISQNLENLRTAALRGRELIRQILAFSRKSPRALKTVPVMSLVKETANLLRSAIPTSINIALDTHSTRDSVRGDPVQIQQVLVNLATNASQAMLEGGTMTIVLRNTSLSGRNLPDPGLRPGDYLALSVSDTGHGMDEETRSHLFEPFFTRKAPQGGSGLGLSVVYGIVKAHNGAITVRTKPGKGSTFTVFLPLAATEGERTAERLPTEVKGKGRILFVDDEQLVTEMAKDALSRLGYEVTTETEPEKALGVFAENGTYDMVITDQSMPGMTGMALARRLLDIRTDLPIVLCTGYSSAVNEESVKAAGIKAFLMKPYTRGELSETVAKVLSHDEK